MFFSALSYAQNDEQGKEVKKEKKNPKTERLSKSQTTIGKEYRRNMPIKSILICMHL